MGISINTNTSATLASQNLSKSNMLLQKSLQRLSSGSKIASASDDAGGLAVSLRLAAALKRTEATTSNVSNAMSFLQTQDGSLGNLSNILSRMSELRTLANDVTKTTSDITNYYTEFTALQGEFSKTMAESFNGISLFNTTTVATSLTVKLSEDGAQSMIISTFSLKSAALTKILGSSMNFSSVAKFQTAVGGLSTISAAISEIATDRATNGAQTSRLQFALDSLASNLTNLESANSRIIDVDVAAETTRLARNNILVQAGTAMLSQANASSQIALKLLQ
jgi:flagellin